MTGDLLGELGRLKAQNGVLLQLTLAQRRPARDFAEELRRIAEAAAGYLDVARVGIWLFDAGRTALTCIEAWDARAGEHSAGEELSAAAYPAYFKACRSERCIDASDAAADPRTRELAADYLDLHGIGSMLDSPIFLGEVQRGVVCHEHVGPPRAWTEEERSFSASVGDLVALTLAAQDRLESARQIEALVEVAPHGILVVGGDGAILRLNRAAEEILECPRSDLLGHPVEDVLPGAFDGPDPFVRRAVAEERSSPEHLVRARRSVSGEFTAEVSATPITRGRAPCALVVVEDVTERLAAASALRESERLYRSVVEDQTDFILRAEQGGRVVFGNRALCEYFGVPPDEVQRRNVFEFVPEDDHGIVRESAEALSPDAPVVEYTHRARRPDGALATIAWTLRGFFDGAGELTGYQAIGRDVTRELYQAERLREAQRLEALAVLAGGIAHDFNNLLTPILSFADLVKITLPPESEEADALGHVIAAATRARELARQVLIFSRREETTERRPILASPFIRETVAFVRASTPSRIDVELDVDTDCGVVRANPSDVYQILSNLCTNAVQAMPAGGKLSVSASAVVLEGRPTLQILVRDTGAGIAEADRERVFEPFFTTKARGQGTGLGLSLVRGLVEELGGAIDLHSTPGLGTTFAVHLPAVAEQPEAPAPREPAGALGGTERVLVVDDEPAIVDALRSTLSGFGYRVTGRGSANEALATLAEDPRAFDAAVLDFTMPHMTGAQLAQELRALRPGLPVVVVSGFGQLLTEGELRAAGVAACVPKPFLGEDVARALRQALATATAT